MTTRFPGVVTLALSSLVFGLTFFCTGCGKSDAQLRFVNASPDESRLDYSLDGTTLASSVAYGTGSSYDSVVPGPRHLQVYPSGSTTAIVDETVSLSSGTDYTLLASNFSSDIAAIRLTDDNSAPSAGNVKLRFVNASPAMGTVDVYVVAPGTDLNTVKPNISSLGFDTGSSYVPVTTGTWEMRFTSPGQKVALVDSGPLTLASGQIRTVVALNGEAGGYTTAILNDLN